MFIRKHVSFEMTGGLALILGLGMLPQQESLTLSMETCFGKLKSLPYTSATGLQGVFHSLQDQILQ